MPVNTKVMDNLVKEYGAKGPRIYYAMENEGKIKPPKPSAAPKGGTTEFAPGKLSAPGAKKVIKKGPAY